MAAGLNLGAGASIRGGGGIGSGSYTPLTPASALPPTNNIAQQAYGINGSGGATWNPNISSWGSVGVGLISMGLLVYLWWSLPR